MEWLKAFHIIFMVTWFAGLFYLPRLFVYHAVAEDEPGRERFKVMERKLLAITGIGMLLTLISGLWLLFNVWSLYSADLWLYFKLILVAALIGFHFYCAKIVKIFKNDENERGHVFYRWLNEAPVLALFGIVIFVVVKPF